MQPTALKVIRVHARYNVNEYLHLDFKCISRGCVHGHEEWKVQD